MLKRGVISRGTGSQRLGPYEDKLGFQPLLFGLINHKVATYSDVTVGQATR